MNILIATQCRKLCHWSPAEDARLHALVGEEPTPFEAILARFKERAPGAVAGRLQRLGLQHRVDMTGYRRLLYRRYRRRSSLQTQHGWTRWSAVEDAALRAAVESGLNFAELAGRLPGRTDLAVIGRLRQLGLADRIAGPRPRRKKSMVSRHSRRTRQYRPCLTCRQMFRSEGPHNRLCDACREQIADLSPYAF